MGDDQGATRSTEVTGDLQTMLDLVKTVAEEQGLISNGFNYG